MDNFYLHKVKLDLHIVKCYLLLAWIDIGTHIHVEIRSLRRKSEVGTSLSGEPSAHSRVIRFSSENFMNDAQSDSWLCKRTNILSISRRKKKL